MLVAEMHQSTSQGHNRPISSILGSGWWPASQPPICPIMSWSISCMRNAQSSTAAAQQQHTQPHADRLLAWKFFTVSEWRHKVQQSKLWGDKHIKQQNQSDTCIMLKKLTKGKWPKSSVPVTTQPRYEQRIKAAMMEIMETSGKREKHHLIMKIIFCMKENLASVHICCQL